MEHAYALGLILAFVMDDEPVARADGTLGYDHDNVYAVVETCEFVHAKSSLFSTKWKAAFIYVGPWKRKVRRLELVAVSAFVRHCLMVAIDETESEFEEIWMPKTWAKQFHKCIFPSYMLIYTI